MIAKYLYKTKKLISIMHPSSYTRPMIKAIQDKNQKDLVGLEIGVDEGLNTLNILKNLNIKKLYLIDPYLPVEYNSGLKFDWSKHKRTAIRRLAEYEDKIKFIFKSDIDAVDDVPNDLDFVYVDGNHDYKYVKRDIELYYSKVKVGGIFGGHDFSTSSLGCCRAVIEFTKKEKLKLYGKEWDWWVIKNDRRL